MLAIPFPQFDPIAFAIPEIFGIGPLGIRWYALAYLGGFVLGWWYGMALARRTGGRPEPRDIEDFLTWAVIGVILGGRLGFVLVYNLSHYLENPLDIFAVWEGGMAFHGGLVGVIVAIVLFARVRGISALRLGDIIACVTPIGLFLGRIANFINNELWGRPTDLPWGVVFPIPPEWQPWLDTVARHPSQLYEAFLEGVVLFVLLLALFLRPGVRGRPGLLTGVFLTGYGLARFLVEFVRQYDPRFDLYLGVFTDGQLLSAPMIAAGLGFIRFAMSRRPVRAEA
jgi:phosphatidylglycerol:prolipoprotein diacylglycerol transferase